MRSDGSTLVVVSPWVKRGYVTKVHYDDPALWRTIEMLLGVPPLSQLTAMLNAAGFATVSAHPMQGAETVVVGTK